jgi:hypothetical protein
LHLNLHTRALNSTLDTRCRVLGAFASPATEALPDFGAAAV